MSSRLLSILFFLASVAGAQERTFAGAWEARYQGTLFCVIVVQPGDTPAGNLSCGSITVNADGDLTEVRAPRDDQAAPLQKVKLEGPKLSFEVDDGDGPMKLELVITGDKRAELHFLDGPAKIKPIRFARN